MKKQIIDVAFILTLLVVMTGKVAAVPPPMNVPDAGSSSFLMVLALGGLAAARKFIR